VVEGEGDALGLPLGVVEGAVLTSLNLHSPLMSSYPVMHEQEYDPA
jgi:hypothetical protein